MGATMRTTGIVIDRTSPMPLQRQLYEALLRAILSGQLQAGARVLSSRELSSHLGLSRNTILDALNQLYAEGYLITERGVGTFVAPAIESRARNVLPRNAQTQLVPSKSAHAFLAAHSLASNLSIDAPFRPGIPALDLFPVALFKRGIRASDWNSSLLDYPNAFGDERMRDAIARRLQQTRGVVCSPDQVLVTSGAQAAFALIGHVLLNANDLVIVEEPGYPNVRASLAAFRARIYAAPVDSAGVKVASFAKRRAKLVHVTPSHQYPTGAVLSLERRFALLDWASRNDAWIIEDDYDSEFHYTGRPQPALQGLDQAHRVLYVGTFSKVLSPGLRVGYIVVPKSLRSAFEAAQQVIGGQPSRIVQSALASFIERGQLARHIARMRKVYDDRRRFVASELTRVAGDVFHVQDFGAGLHFIVELPASISDVEFERRAKTRGILVPALSGYFHGRPTRNGLVIGYAATSIPRAKEAIDTLAGLI